MPRARTARSSRLLAMVAAAALAAACTTDDGATTDPPADDQATPQDELDPDELEALEDLLQQQQEELPDPEDNVEDGVFRGVGVMMPAPDGWQLDPMSLAQGIVVAITDDAQQTLVAQAVDTADLDQELDYDELVENSRAEFGGDPDADEEISLAGAARAHLLRFDDLPAQQADLPDNTLLTLIADDGAGELAMFNYVAPTEDYDEDTESQLLSQGGFDPDSDPLPPGPVG